MNTPATTAMRQRGQCQRTRANAAKITVVIAIVVETASPNAAARLAEERNSSTSAMVPSISSQFSAGR